MNTQTSDSHNVQSKPEAYRDFLAVEAQKLKHLFTSFNREQYLDWVAAWKETYEAVSRVNRHNKTLGRMNPNNRPEKAAAFEKALLQQPILNELSNMVATVPNTYANRTIYLMVVRKASKLAAQEAYEKAHSSAT
jgi:hypothetical protein